MFEANIQMFLYLKQYLHFYICNLLYSLNVIIFII